MKEYIELLRDMMACRSVSSDVAAVNKVSAMLQKFLEAHGVTCIVEDCNGRNCLFASTVPGKEVDYLLNSHLDVVPPDRPEDHILRIEGNIAYGRGVEDCLGNVLAVSKTLIDLKGRGNVGVMFSMDEEIGGYTVAEMVRRGYKARKLAIVMDGGAYAVYVAQKGILSLKLIAEGKGGHSSQPWNFDNPIDKLMDGYLRLRKQWPAVTKDDVWKDSLAATMFTGGRVHNQIPDTAEMFINIRFTKTGDAARLIEYVRTVTGLRVELIETCEPFNSDETLPVIQGLLQALKEEFPERNVGTARMCGATDARHLLAIGCPIAVMGIPGGGAHSADEWSDLKGIEGYAAFLVKYFSGK